MRILLLSKYGQSSNLLYEGTRFGLKENGVDFLDININLEREEEAPHWVSIPTLEKKDLLPNDQKIIEKIRNYNPDFILLLQYSGLQFLVDNGESIKQAIKANCKIGFWLVDLAEEIFPNKILSQYIDFFFISNAEQIAGYKRKWGIKKVFFMPQGCYIVESKNENKKYPVGFIGRRQHQDKRYRERNLLLDAIKGQYGLAEADNITDYKKVADFYHQCRIVIGSNWRNDVLLYSSDRLFNVLGSGSFYLCSYFPGIEKIFAKRVHLDWFKTIEEATSLAGYYLDNPEICQKIALSGLEIVKKEHTYPKRIENIIRIMENKSSNFEGYLK